MEHDRSLSFLNQLIPSRFREHRDFSHFTITIDVTIMQFELLKPPTKHRTRK